MKRCASNLILKWEIEKGLEMHLFQIKLALIAAVEVQFRWTEEQHFEIHGSHDKLAKIAEQNSIYITWKFNRKTCKVKYKRRVTVRGHYPCIDICFLAGQQKLNFSKVFPENSLDQMRLKDSSHTKSHWIWCSRSDKTNLAEQQT